MNLLTIGFIISGGLALMMLVMFVYLSVKIGDVDRLSGYNRDEVENLHREIAKIHSVLRKFCEALSKVTER